MIHGCLRCKECLRCTICGGCEHVKAFGAFTMPDMSMPLLTIVAAERDAERKAWARLVRAEDRMHGPPGAICVPSEKTEREYEAAKQALRDLGVDVDALLEEP